MDYPQRLYAKKQNQYIKIIKHKILYHTKKADWQCDHFVSLTQNFIKATHINLAK